MSESPAERVARVLGMSDDERRAHIVHVIAGAGSTDRAAVVELCQALDLDPAEASHGGGSCCETGRRLLVRAVTRERFG